MQTIKGLIALFVVALVVFLVVGRNDIKSQNQYAAQLRAATAVNAVAAKTPAAAGPAKAGEPATNTVHQAGQKTKSANL